MENQISAAGDGLCCYRSAAAPSAVSCNCSCCTQTAFFFASGAVCFIIYSKNKNDFLQEKPFPYYTEFSFRCVKEPEEMPFAAQEVGGQQISTHRFFFPSTFPAPRINPSLPIIDKQRSFARSCRELRPAASPSPTPGSFSFPRSSLSPCPAPLRSHRALQCSRLVR